MNSTILKSVLKPGRYSGGEYGQTVKDKNDINCRFAFCFPDTYEIGMSNLGMRILYGALNSEKDIWCERVFAPWTDMQEKMKEHGMLLSTLESGDEVRTFDFLGITLQYELCYTTVLNVLSLSGIPLLASERGEEFPIVIGGGHCAYNPEPIADFFDIFSIGEGEEALVELCRLYIDMKASGKYTKAAFLREAAKLEGFYVPSLYEVSYNEDGTIKAFEPKFDDVPKKIRKRIIKDLDKVYYPTKTYMPYIETVQDKMVLEVYRGCIRGCRFCQAGMVCRPVREKSTDKLFDDAKCMYANSGYDEMTLSSLSISDYSNIDELTDKFSLWATENNISLSLPSLRLDSFTKELMDKVSTVKTGSLTFAPEAGTQRLRDAINKNVCEADLLRAVNVAFDVGKTSVKLYFMNGLPTETDEDIEGIALLAEKVLDTFYANPNRNKQRRPSVTISVSCFVPKPFTPFQWEKQDTYDELMRKQELLKSKITNRKIVYNYHDAKVSYLEAVFARGDRRLSKALLLAAKKGRTFDAWTECFDFDAWMEIFREAGIDADFYATRGFGLDEILPWDMIEIGVTKEFLMRERANAYEHKTTPSCREKCSACGANKLGGERKCCP
ncbi:MAG: TIGR03960 family B12-binding radical SAM protein [Clostridia bacterium]|nr:TIGR03960 family B12-binding radical SAM protein [Clostridia bacterium]MBQ6614272.1 TIGR03960 family B12-binding radical SAM protein [Clostridia bacterium]